MCKESVVRAALTAAQEHCALCPRRCGAVRARAFKRTAPMPAMLVHGFLFPCLFYEGADTAGGS